MRGNPNAHFMMGVFIARAFFPLRLTRQKLSWFILLRLVVKQKVLWQLATHILRCRGSKDWSAQHYTTNWRKRCNWWSGSQIVDHFDEQKILSDAFYKNNNKNNDDAEVVQYFQYAADKNLKRGLIGLGQLYCTVPWTKTKFLKAFHLFKVAATKHSSGSGYANQDTCIWTVLWMKSNMIQNLLCRLRLLPQTQNSIFTVTTITWFWPETEVCQG